MKRVSREHTVPVDKRYQITEAVAEVDLRESFVVETINFRTPIIRTPDDANPAVYREREETGPIFLRGIRAGDTVRIHIESIKPVGHASGGRCDESGRNSFLPLSRGRVHFPGGLWAKARPMIGDIYLTPRGVVDNPGDYGGNMDFNDVAPGNSLCLKAQYDGGLLVLGDVHACQGDGELFDMAAECAADVTLRVTREERVHAERPLILKRGSFVCVGARKSYAEARDVAVADAVRILRDLTGITEGEAVLYCKTVGSLRNGAIWNLRSEAEYFSRPDRLPLVVGLEVPVPFLPGFPHA